MASLALPKLYRLSLSFSGHTTSSCCLTALPGRARDEHLFGQGVLFNDSIVYAPDSFIILIILGVGGRLPWKQTCHSETKQKSFERTVPGCSPLTVLEGLQHLSLREDRKREAKIGLR